ncbi:hypothetical protein BXZ70DRAFT_1012289 [Cristinia sonorae]|uniref:NAD(P)-binding protein n=1 Tax=Cristinia sonorae TaxID=1940300 RepID=A0A8K0XKI9_9AGAR|nr:hypothetical protein BXZ70DRAFT_1012289 [Cristinia sonorae]
MADVADYTPNVAVITGSAQGIGKAIALRLAEDGFAVVVSDLGTKQDKMDALVEEVRSKGGRAVAIPTDVTKEADIINLVDKTVEEFGGLDVMIANAGIGNASTFLEMSVELYDLIMNVNARGVMLCYKYAAQQMVKQKRGGRILGASSVLGKQSAGMYLAAYSASKFAVRGLTQSLAQEMAPHKVTVNAYCPGCIITDMVDNPALDATVGTGAPGGFIKYITGIPLDGPEAGPDVVASYVSYLCKPEAHFITGQSLSVCGGVRLS